MFFLSLCHVYYHLNKVIIIQVICNNANDLKCDVIVHNSLAVILVCPHFAKSKISKVSLPFFYPKLDAK